MNEFLQALHRAKKGKAAGPDGIPVELIQSLSHRSKEKLHSYLCQYFTDPNFDVKSWHKVLLALVPKKGDTSLPKNWRPISLLDTISKIVSSIIAKRLDSHLHKVGLQEQAGFTSKRGCVDTTATLKIALQNLHNTNQDTHVLFVDLVKAFDSVHREMLWQLLSKFGLPDTLIDVIKKMYSTIVITARSGEATAQFPSTSGVKQGNNLAPILFLFAIQAVSENLDKK